MKLFALIFGCYIMFLSLLPGINIIVASSASIEMCCSDGCEAPPELPGCEDEDGCNPFQSCYCCIGFNMNFSLPLLASHTFFFKPYSSDKEKIPTHMAPDFWQPPKIA